MGNAKKYVVIAAVAILAVGCFKKYAPTYAAKIGL